MEVKFEKVFNLSEVINELPSPSGWLTAVEWIPFGFYFGNDGGIYISDSFFDAKPRP